MRLHTHTQVASMACFYSAGHSGERFLKDARSAHSVTMSPSFWCQAVPLTRIGHVDVGQLNKDESARNVCSLVAEAKVEWTSPTQLTVRQISKICNEGSTQTCLVPFYFVSVQIFWKYKKLTSLKKVNVFMPKTVRKSIWFWLVFL